MFCQFVKIAAILLSCRNDNIRIYMVAITPNFTHVITATGLVIEPVTALAAAVDGLAR